MTTNNTFKQVNYAACFAMKGVDPIEGNCHYADAVCWLSLRGICHHVDLWADDKDGVMIGFRLHEGLDQNLIEFELRFC